MSIIDQLLGGSSSGDSTSQNSSNLDTVLGTSPSLGLELSDVLHASNSGAGDSGSTSDFTGIGDLGLGLTAPTLVGINASSDSASSSTMEGDHGGGLLGGLL